MEKTEVRDLKGCLSSIMTKDEDKKRRWSSEEDEDRWLMEVVSPFELDATIKLLPSKSIRRLSDKTQVITGGGTLGNRHIRSRLVHTIEVVQIASAISDILGLNTPLCKAIAYGHDIGHTPFGHRGEEFLSEVSGKKFQHEVFSVVIAQHLERKGRMNLTKQVLDGMLSHSRGRGNLTVNGNSTPESAVVMFADKIAYIWADVNDIFYRVRYPALSTYPELKNQIMWFGSKQRQRVHKCVAALCRESAEKGKVSFKDSEEAVRFTETKKLMYEVYEEFNFTGVSKEQMHKVYKLLGKIEGVDPAIAFALLCDQEALKLAEMEDYEPKVLIGLSINEIVPYIRGRNIDFTDPDLKW